MKLSKDSTDWLEGKRQKTNKDRQGPSIETKRNATGNHDITHDVAIRRKYARRKERCVRPSDEVRDASRAVRKLHDKLSATSGDH